MKKGLFILSSFILIFTNCNNEDDDLNTDTNTLHYAINSFDKQSIEIGDTISIFLGDTLLLYINPADNPLVYNTDDEVEIICRGNGEYQCHITKSSYSQIIIKHGENSQATYFYCYIDTHPLEVAYILLENEYTIDVESDSLKKAIAAELRETYAPLELSTYKFSYTCYDTNTQTGSGSMKYASLGADNHVYAGTFIKKKEHIEMQYNSNIFYYTLFSKASEYYFKQDLLETFKSKYPSYSIHNIGITSHLRIQ